MNTDLLVRPAEERDFPAIAEIYGESVRTGTASFELEPPGIAEMTRRWRELSSKGYPYVVATRGGALLGYAYAGPYRARPAYRFSVEDSVYIAPQAQGAGVGRALLSEVIRACEERGFRQMIAIIGGGTEHPASVKLHERLGFRQIGVLEGCGFKHERWLDTLLMQRALGDGMTTRPKER